MMRNPISTLAGPPLEKASPELTNKPAPIDPPAGANQRQG
jgi:hypothetical protein